MKDCESRLTGTEKQRNQHGPMQVYVYTDKDLGNNNEPFFKLKEIKKFMYRCFLGQRDAPAYFPPILHNHCQCTELTRDAFVIPADRLVKGLHPKYNPECYIPGFPSIRHLPLKVVKISTIIALLIRYNIIFFLIGNLKEVFHLCVPHEHT